MPIFATSPFTGKSNLEGIQIRTPGKITHDNSIEPTTSALFELRAKRALKQDFEDYLLVLQQAQLISGWIERQVQPGTDWSQVIDPRLQTADIFVPLVSPALLGSGYCSGAEVREAWARRAAGKTLVIPILLRYVDLRGHLFEMIQCIPRKGFPVSSWPNRDDAWRDIDRELRQVLKPSS